MNQSPPTATEDSERIMERLPFISEEFSCCCKKSVKKCLWVLNTTSATSTSKEKKKIQMLFFKINV